MAAARFELPSRYRHFEKVTVRYAAWDLSYVYLADGRSGQILTRLYPQDKQKNADGLRRSKEPIAGNSDSAPDLSSGEMAPLLAKLIADYAACGVAPAYLTKDETNPMEEKTHE